MTVEDFKRREQIILEDIREATKDNSDPIVMFSKFISWMLFFTGLAPLLYRIHLLKEKRREEGTWWK